MTSVGPADSNQALRQGSFSRAGTQANDEDAEQIRAQKENVKWIQQNIEMRKCSYYIVSTNKKSKDICQCGYRKQDHDKTVTDHPKQDQPKQDLKSHTATLKWNCEHHTKGVPTNAFGEIEFVGFRKNKAKFVRVDSKIHIATMLELMMDVWGMEKPNLLISVTGGTENFNMKPHLRDIFRFGVVNAARNTDAWIITGGTHEGVPKHVGEAVKYSFLTSTDQKDIVAIGIAPWGVIQNKDLLEDKKKSEPIKYTIEDEHKENERFLNPNHSHFILVDDGTKHKFGTETPLRAQLECNECTKYDFNLVPAILLVIDGGPDTLSTVKYALTEQKIPVVIVKGSGRSADLLAYAFKNAELVEFNGKDDEGNIIRKTKKNLNKSLKDYIRNQMRYTKFCKMGDISKNIKEIEACLHKFDLIHIFELGSGDQDLEVTMLRALLKANEKDLVEQLRLALTWNWIDFARSEIFTADIGWEPGSLDDIMLSALQANKVDFVELLLDHGVELETFLTIERLLDLYNNEVSSEFPFSDLLLNVGGKKKMESTEKISMKEVGKLIEHLLDDYYLLHYRSKKDPLSVQEGEDLLEEEKFENPCLHMLIWSVLNNLQDMAKLFWRKGMDSIAAALVAHALLSAMSNQLHDVKITIHEEIEANSREFLNLATGVMERCYRTNENSAHAVLTGDLLQWEKASCILIAMKTNNQAFISSNACQEVFSNIWMGEMKQENGILTLLTCIFIPFLIPLWVTFKENKDNGPVPVDDLTSDTSQEDQAVQESSPNVGIQESHPSLQLQGTQDDVGEETNDDSGDYNEQETKDDLADERTLIQKLRRVKDMIKDFYRAPVVIFLSHVISYMAFLCLYSYILISKFDEKLSLEDIILIAWVVNILIEEISQVIATRYMYTEIKLKAYIADFWNIADILIILTFVIGMILKHINYPETLEAARVVLCVNLISFFLRLLQIFSLNKELGPNLVMIYRMVRNLTSFFVMLLIFIVAYAIASHAILYPNTEISFNFLRVIFRRPYWNIYGELMLDEIEGTNDCTNIEELYKSGTQPRCPTESGKYFVPVLMGVYMLMCNILLLNLLISIFSYTLQQVQENADMHWRIQRYHQIHEYITRPVFFPLVSLLANVFQIIVFLNKCLCGCKQEDRTSRENVFLRPFSDENVRQELREWESSIAGTIITSEQVDLESIDKKVKSLTLRLDQLVSKIDDLQEQQHAGTETIEDVRYCPSRTDCRSERESSTVVQPGTVNFDKRMENIENKLQWIVDTLKEHQPGAEQACPEKTDERVEG